MKNSKSQVVRNTARRLKIKHQNIAQYFGMGKREFARLLRMPLSKTQEGQMLQAIADIAKGAAGDHSFSSKLYCAQAGDNIVFLWELAHKLGCSESELIHQMREGLGETKTDAAVNALVELLHADRGPGI